MVTGVGMLCQESLNRLCGIGTSLVYHGGEAYYQYYQWCCGAYSTPQCITMDIILYTQYAYLLHTTYAQDIQQVCQWLSQEYISVLLCATLPTTRIPCVLHVHVCTPLYLAQSPSYRRVLFGMVPQVCIWCTIVDYGILVATRGVSVCGMRTVSPIRYQQYTIILGVCTSYTIAQCAMLCILWRDALHGVLTVTPYEILCWCVGVLVCATVLVCCAIVCAAVATCYQVCTHYTTSILLMHRVHVCL